MMVCLFFVLFVIKDFFEFLLYFLTAKATGKDGAVGGKEEDVGDANDAVEVGGYILRVEDLRVRNLLFLYGSQRSCRFVPCGYAHHFQTFVLIFVVCSDKVRYFLSAWSTP